MKKISFIIGVIMLAGVLFAVGLITGTSWGFMNNLFQVSTFDHALVDTSKTLMKIIQLDEGNTEFVKDYLNLELDNHIITLNEFIEDHPNPESKEQAIKALARIAEHRKEYPPSKNENSEELENHIQIILNSALEKNK